MDEKPSVVNEARRPSHASSRVAEIGAEKVRIEHSHMVMPEALIGLSEEEIQQIGRKATFKLDCFILPSITIMYIMNYLDRQASLHDSKDDLALTCAEYCQCQIGGHRSGPQLISCRVPDICEVRGVNSI